ncbi:PREDICTED: uncharacterized protein LOC107191574 [Dufourea novaeangliae]|uniref:uncharacterized protein LOC107191574 n=1 Tax=Dufourea novaeangliae TaxID=178035 RepID=UPI00076757C9|nr:PREDICTED: uncharacterized protein LOC107191574 [Dufourea novaeangliae]
MNLDKSKISAKHVSDINDSVKRRRSSLAVNLSCFSNLTDSGNGSLKQTNVEYNDNIPPTAVTSDRILRSKRTFIDNRSTSYRDISLKHVTVVLKKIENDTEVLNKSCEKLKQVILTRTKQIFDVQNELPVKTQAILTTKHNQSRTLLNSNSNGNVNPGIDSTVRNKRKNKNYGEERKQYNLNTINKSILPIEAENSRINCSVASKDECFPLLNVSDDGSIFTAEPIGCSTMINNETSDQNLDINSEIIQDPSLGLVTKKADTSMEMTDIRGGFILSGRQNSSEYLISDNVCKNHMEEMQNKKILRSKCSSITSLLHKSSNTLGKFNLFNNITKQNTNVQSDSENEQPYEKQSPEALQTSLNVNTSVDELSRDNRNENDFKDTDFIEKDYNRDIGNRQKRGMHSAISEGTRESTNTVCTSLQMNTSLDSSNRLCSLKNNNRQMSVSNNIGDRIVNRTNRTETDGTDLTENLKQNISMVHTDRSNSIAMKNKLNIDKIDDGQSYVEATPYPTCRSVLLKTKLRSNTVVRSRPSNNTNRSLIEINSSQSKSRFSKSVFNEFQNSPYEQEKSGINTIVSDSSFSQSASYIKSQNLFNENELINSQGAAKSISPVRKKCKKKLLPLLESSQLLSFSPVENENEPPGRSMPANRHRKKKKKKQHVNNKMNAIDNTCVTTKHVDGKNNDQLALENDCSIFDGKMNRVKRPKKVVSKKIIVKKIVHEDILRRLEQNGENIQTKACTSNRNSSSDFQTLKKLCTMRSSRRKAQRINIVMTGLSNDDKHTVKSIVKALGHAKIESNVTKRTTHVITTGVRTINLLHGIIRGCWLLSTEWILKSLENNAWLNPEEYEITHFSKAALENRKDRQLFGMSYVPELFAACGNIYIGKNTTPPYNVLKDLVKTAGGRITDHREIAKIIIDTKSLKESWILDCITTGELQPFDHYQQS